MKKITINIPDKYADVVSITTIGGAGTSCINVKTSVFDITSVKDEYEIDMFTGVIKQNEDCVRNV